MNRPRLLILHAGQHDDGLAARVALAARDGAAATGEADVIMLRAAEAGIEDLLAAQALLLVTPEKFGYMAGLLKDFFDRTFYPAQGKVAGLPYALIVVAGNDGRGAVTAVERIVAGYPFKAVAPPSIWQGAPTEADWLAARELGAALASGLALGVF
ncbi:NAD(P)H-dependent oxidoreductase [Chitinimonas sp. BJYL2]|uniref:NAD(P)H-dependent oxidoreductase n=1 Tax=Chitinimonas sp. BJYL2 TaxID=2976696 RepID=UPI0022B4311F|nr:NAD(P)H-dependent oxidoreductase [Chitinimonas sp. BJYL2]